MPPSFCASSLIHLVSLSFRLRPFPVLRFRAFCIFATVLTRAVLLSLFFFLSGCVTLVHP